MTEKDKDDHLTFLSSLLKDQSYVKMTYMTGILPIAKYSSGSKLNMFAEYTMAEEETVCVYFVNVTSIFTNGYNICGR